MCSFLGPIDTLTHWWALRYQHERFIKFGNIICPWHLEELQHYLGSCNLSITCIFGRSFIDRFVRFFALLWNNLCTMEKVMVVRLLPHCFGNFGGEGGGGRGWGPHLWRAGMARVQATELTWKPKRNFILPMYNPHVLRNFEQQIGTTHYDIINYICRPKYTSFNMKSQLCGVHTSSFLKKVKLF